MFPFGISSTKKARNLPDFYLAEEEGIRTLGGVNLSTQIHGLMH